jgi:hypothetical protein
VLWLWGLRTLKNQTCFILYQTYIFPCTIPTINRLNMASIHKAHRKKNESLMM